MLNLKKIVIGVLGLGVLTSVLACECQSVDKLGLSIKGAASTISSIFIFSKN